MALQPNKVEHISFPVAAANPTICPRHPPDAGGIFETRRFKSMFCENCGHQISDTAKFCSACGHPVGTAPSSGVGAPPTVPVKRESPRLKASSGNGSISRMSGIRRKPWILRMPIPDPHTGITVVKSVGTYVTREEAEAARAEMMKRPATPYQDSTLAKIHEIFLESREYKGRSDKARELYDLETALVL